MRVQPQALMALLLLGACGEEGAPPLVGITEAPLSLKAVDWNSKKVAVGKVSHLVEVGEDTLVLGDQGAQVFTSGLLLSSDSSSKSWLRTFLVRILLKYLIRQPLPVLNRGQGGIFFENLAEVLAR